MLKMKKNFFRLTFLSLGLGLFILPSLAATEVCTEKVQPAISPDGQCQVFRDSCDVPEDWRSVPSCELAQTEKIGLSLAERLQHRQVLRSQATKNSETTTEETKTEKTRSARGGTKISRGALTRSTNRYRRLPTAEESTSTERRHFSSRGIKRKASDSAKRDMESTTKTQQSYYRAKRQSYRSSRDTNRAGSLKTQQSWNSLSAQKTTQRSYGRNPYRLGYRYQADQKATRDAREETVDAEARRYSNSRRYRGDRNIGNLDSDIEFQEQEAEKMEEVWDELQGETSEVEQN